MFHLQGRATPTRYQAALDVVASAHCASARSFARRTSCSLQTAVDRTTQLASVTVPQRQPRRPRQPRQAYRHQQVALKHHGSSDASQVQHGSHRGCQHLAPAAGIHQQSVVLGIKGPLCQHLQPAPPNNSVTHKSWPIHAVLPHTPHLQRAPRGVTCNIDNGEVPKAGLQGPVKAQVGDGCTDANRGT